VDIPVPAGAGLFVPNAFSPDGDGINEVFVPFVSGLKEPGYQFLIFDRWGQELFATTRMGEGWSGNFGNGDPAPVGVYVWKLIGRERYGTGRVDRTGHVTLVR
jgi:gliding motility-associated-like protein